MSSYYTEGVSGKEVSLTAPELVRLYEQVKKQSNVRNTQEKKAQSRLVIGNNNNPASRWFCIDVEYTKPAQKARFDIIAISKERPHKVALIEVKYGADSLGRKCGVREHIKDFYSFFVENSFDKLKSELISIIQCLQELDVGLPLELQHLKEEDISSVPEFYIVVLNNKSESRGSTPKQTVSGYLFQDGRWGSKKQSSLITKEGDYFAIINHDKSFPLTFLFSESTLPNLGIVDILDDDSYTKEVISL